MTSGVLGSYLAMPHTQLESRSGIDMYNVVLNPE